jgi:hypothetical protein
LPALLTTRREEEKNRLIERRNEQNRFVERRQEQESYQGNYIPNSRKEELGCLVYDQRDEGTS